MSRRFPDLFCLALAIVISALPQSAAAQSRSDLREADKGGAQVSPVTSPVTGKKAALTINAPPLQVTLSPDGRTIFIVGLIGDGSFQRFDTVLRGAPKVRRVHLSSAGGLTLEARMIAALVRKHRLDTYVEYYCASACTQIFAAGQTRLIGPRAQVGFHQAVLIDPKGAGALRLATDRKLNSTTVFGVNGNDTLRLAYELAGIDHAFIDKALSYDHDSMWLPPPAEMLEAHVITRLISASEVEPDRAGAISRDAVLAKLTQLPLWRIALERHPAATTPLVDDVWRYANSGNTLDKAIDTGRTRLVAEVLKGLSRAPDAYLDRALTLYATAARSERERGYPACASAPPGASSAPNGEDAAFAAQEDSLLTDLMLSTERVPRMDGEEANTIFTRQIIPLLVDAYRTESITKREGRCRIGFRTFEAIDGMAPKKRIKAYRALLSLPGTNVAE